MLVPILSGTMFSFCFKDQAQVFSCCCYELFSGMEERAFCDRRQKDDSAPPYHFLSLTKSFIVLCFFLLLLERSSRKLFLTELREQSVILIIKYQKVLVVFSLQTAQAQGHLVSELRFPDFRSSAFSLHLQI